MPMKHGDSEKQAKCAVLELGLHLQWLKYLQELVNRGKTNAVLLPRGVCTAICHGEIAMQF